MENLENLKTLRREEKNARIVGTSKELQIKSKEAKNFTKDMKEKRPRPSYKDNFNIEQDERNRKRQNRDEIVQEKNNMENMTQEENNLEDSNTTQEENENGINERLNNNNDKRKRKITSPETIEEENSEESEIDLPKRKKIKRSEMINDLLDELSQEEL